MDQVYINKVAISQVLDELKIGISRVNVVEGPFVDRYEIHPLPGQSAGMIKRAAHRLEKALDSEGFRMFCEGCSVVIELWHGKMCGANQCLEPLMGDFHYEFPLSVGLDQQGNAIILDPASIAGGIILAGLGSKATLDRLCAMCLKNGATVVQISAEAEVPAAIPAAEKVYSGSECIGASDAVQLMRAICQDIEMRTKAIRDAGCQDFWEIRKLSPASAPGYVAVILNETARLLKDKKKGVELKRLLLTIATCGPRVGVFVMAGWEGPIDTLVKFNFPCRIVSRTDTAKESIDYLDTEGAEKLVEGGFDALLYDSTRGEVTRITAII